MSVNSERQPKQQKRVAVLGTGLMGAGMAQSLARAGHQVTLWNRTRKRAEEAASPGARVVDTPAQAAAASDVAVLMLADPAAVRTVLSGPDGLLAGLRPGAVVIDSSTVDPGTTRACAEQVRAAGGRFLDAPVYGSKNEAQGGQLGFLVGGSRETLEAVSDLFIGCMAKAVHHMGETGAGSTTKLVLNAQIAMTLHAAEEALVLAKKAGLDPKAVYEVLMGSRARSGILEMKGQKILDHDFSAFFALRLMDKDLRLALETASAAGASMPVLATVKLVFTAAIAAGHGEEDFCVAVTALEQASGTRL
jgi:3-hydroxyisobutyrate dehydrogenase-like beta-hydroxyacid dehydrogenase